MKIVYGEIMNTLTREEKVFVRYGKDMEETVNVEVSSEFKKEVAKFKKTNRGGLKAEFIVDDNNNWTFKCLKQD